MAKRKASKKKTAKKPATRAKKSPVKKAKKKPAKAAAKKKKTAKKKAGASPKKKKTAKKKAAKKKKAAPKKKKGSGKKAAGKKKTAAKKAKKKTKKKASKKAAKKRPAKKKKAKGKKSRRASKMKKTAVLGDPKDSPLSLPVSRSESVKRSQASKLPIPYQINDGDFLPEWFGGYGLTSCFNRLGIFTVGELRNTSEEEIRDACGIHDTTKLKARLERMQDQFALEEHETDEDLRPISERFAYFLKGGMMLADGTFLQAGDHICDIVYRPDAKHVTVRLARKQDDGWQDVTVTRSQLELISREDRRRDLVTQDHGDLEQLCRDYEVPATGDATAMIGRILEFEFSEFGRKW